ncbi:oligoendopeptidase, pepF/M3 family [Abditibacterium utsteinense]|uniref:Oligoendopeptidase, pepF/M3 family n=1 Tax=Abditibacterium utsteinense TaxID=1960156 RepID=A0A2S8SUD6_9BACT|nr:M3 family oligoendopeptidase [Abditibacterium utsteinense]PQV64413.1 oligoendopeptidase, pepF/M3 family [Abditibacterium utsteinense]
MTNQLPNWDMTPIFPSLESAQFETEFHGALDEIDALSAEFDTFSIRRRESAEIDTDFVAQFEQIVGAWNTLEERLDTLGSYITCFVTTDAKNEVAKARESEFETRVVALGQLQTRLVAWIGSSDIETLIQQSQVAKNHEFFVRRAHFSASHQMSESEENLASSLSPMGLGGWAKLHGTVSSLLSAKVNIDGEEKSLPMSAIRALASDPNRENRRAAFDSEIAAWQGVAPTLAAALNGIKGFQRETRARRGFVDDVEPTLAGNSIDAATLSAMQAACVAAFPDFRRYMKAKARALNLEKLAWFDLIAPLGEDGKKWDWSETETFTEENFGRYSPRLADFARRSFEEKWIDAPPIAGKVGGAYCTGTRPGESRVLMNFDGSFTAVSTLAHELGHAYHNLCLESRTPLQSQIPMTLAETASIFCETLVFEGAVQGASREERIALLDNALSRNLQVVVDIHSRFRFEQSVFEKRGERELTETEFCDLMTSAQRETYGEDLEPLHPYMWAVKGHYYGPKFYNYPYTFGLLLALGLYAHYQKEPETFRAKYDDFLSKCGLSDAQTLGEEFGFDLRGSEFWEGSLGIIRAQIDEFEKLIA